VEFTRFAAGDPVQAEWCKFAGLDEAFGSAPGFANVVSHIVALPTHSEWTVLWNNSFLCDGYDSLCWCITTHHGLTTLHWAAHDDWTTFQSGARFTFRERDAAEFRERTVYVGQEDKRWLFHESGSPLPEENTSNYAARLKRDRLNERTLLAMLEALGARPWSEAYYALESQQAFVLSRAVPPAAVQRAREQVLLPT
jgi:hypothetical protein